MKVITAGPKKKSPKRSNESNRSNLSNQRKYGEFLDGKVNEDVTKKKIQVKNEK